MKIKKPEPANLTEDELRAIVREVCALTYDRRRDAYDADVELLALADRLGIEL